MGRTPLRAPRPGSVQWQPKANNPMPIDMMQGQQTGGMDPMQPMSGPGPNGFPPQQGFVPDGSGQPMEEPFEQAMQPQSFPQFAAGPMVPPDGAIVMNDGMQAFPVAGIPADSQIQDRWESCWEYMNTGWCPRGLTCRWEHRGWPGNNIDSGLQFWSGDDDPQACIPCGPPGDAFDNGGMQMQM